MDEDQSVGFLNADAARFRRCGEPDISTHGLNAVTSFHGTGATVVVSGVIDYDTTPRLREALGACLACKPSRIGVDLGGVSFCDCAGLNALLWARHRARSAGIGLDVNGTPAPIVQRFFDVTGAAQLFRTGQASGHIRAPVRPGRTRQADRAAAARDPATSAATAGRRADEPQAGT